MVPNYYHGLARSIKIVISTFLLTFLLVPCTTAVAGDYPKVRSLQPQAHVIAHENLRVRPVQPRAHVLRPKRIDPRVAEFNRDVADYKRTVAALRRDSQHLQALQSRLDTLNKELSGSAQIDMINLQSIMSNRQTAVQLSTNLIQALSHSADAIAGNTGK